MVEPTYYRVVGQIDDEVYFDGLDVVQVIEWARGAVVGRDIGQPITVQYKDGFSGVWKELPGVNTDPQVTKSMSLNEWRERDGRLEERTRVMDLIRYHVADTESEGIGPEEAAITGAIERLARDVASGKCAP